MTSCVPLYDASGAFQGSRSLDSVNRLLGIDRVTVVRNRKGHIVRAFMRHESGNAAVLKTAYLGTRYSYREQLGDGHYAYALTKLHTAHRPIFLEVVRGCLTA